MRLSMQLYKMTAIVLAIALLCERVALAIPTPDAAGAKQQIAARGVGKGVKVHESDGTVLRGKIMSVGEDSFALQVGSKPALEVPYTNVRAVDGPGLSKGAKIGIAVGAAVAIVAATVAVVVARATSGPLFLSHF